MALTRIVWSPAMLGYDFGPQHPMAPLRLDLTFRLAEELGVLAAPGVEVTGAEPASDEVLRTAHDQAYVDAVRRASTTGEPAVDRGLGTDDDPVFPGMHDAAARVVTGSVESALAIWTGRAQHAVNLAGGMSEEEILSDFPELTHEDIRACLAFAADRERKLMTVPAL